MLHLNASYMCARLHSTLLTCGQCPNEQSIDALDAVAVIGVSVEVGHPQKKKRR